MSETVEQTERDLMIALLWKLHLAWMEAIVNLAYCQGYDVNDELHRAMTAKDKELNKTFAFFMTDLVNGIDGGEGQEL